MSQQIPDVLQDHELARLLAVPNLTTPSGLRNRCLLELMANAGLRSKEVLGIKTSDVRQDGEKTLLHLKVTKGSKVRRVPLSPDSAGLLALWLAKRKELGIVGKIVFCTISSGRRQSNFAEDPELEPGKPLNSRYLRELVSRCGKKAGIGRRVHPHICRHSFATRLLRHSNVRVVQAALGHASLTSTQVYLHVLNDELTEAMTSLPSPETGERRNGGGEG